MSFFCEIAKIEKSAQRTLARQLTTKVWIYRNGKRQQIDVSWNGKGSKAGVLRLPLGVAHLCESALPMFDYDAGNRVARLAPFELRAEQSLFLKRILKEPTRQYSQAWDLLPSFGKTIAALYAAAWLGLPTIVVCHRTDLVKMWQHDAERFNVNIQAVMLSSLSKLDATQVRSSCIIVDEAHACCTRQSVVALAQLEPRVLIGLSGTFYRKDDLGPYVEWFFGERLKMDEEAKAAYDETKTGKIWFVQINTCVFPNPDANGWGRVLESCWQQKERQELICSTVGKLLCEGYKGIVFVKSCEHGRILCEALVRLGHDAYTRFSDDALRPEFDCVVSTFAKMGTGVSDARLNLVVLAEDALQYIEQYVYRGSRKKDQDCLLIDFCDNGRALLKHAAERKRKYLSLGFLQREI